MEKTKAAPEGDADRFGGALGSAEALPSKERKMMKKLGFDIHKSNIRAKMKGYCQILESYIKTML